MLVNGHPQLANMTDNAAIHRGLGELQLELRAYRCIADSPDVWGV
jgi:hypothetical protein